MIALGILYYIFTCNTCPEYVGDAGEINFDRVAMSEANGKRFSFAPSECKFLAEFEREYYIRCRLDDEKDALVELEKSTCRRSIFLLRRGDPDPQFS